MNPLSPLCRLCLYRSEPLIDIFNENGKHGYVAAEVIEDLLQLQVVRDDGYPRQVCIKCLNRLTDFKLFKMQCYDSHAAFDKEYRGSIGPVDSRFPSISSVSKGLVAADEETVTDDYFPLKGTQIEVKTEKIDAEDDAYDVNATGGITAEVVIKTESFDCVETFSQSVVATEVAEDAMTPSQDGSSGVAFDGRDVGRIRVRDLWGGVGGVQSIESGRLQEASYSSLQIPRDPSTSTSCISYEQRILMLEFLERNKQMTFRKKKSSGSNVKRLWDNLSAELNAVPLGSRKSPDKWLKSFQCWKRVVKTKALLTPQGKCGKLPPAPLTYMEKRLLALLNDKDTSAGGAKKVAAEGMAGSATNDSSSPRSNPVPTSNTRVTSQIVTSIDPTQPPQSHEPSQMTLSSAATTTSQVLQPHPEPTFTYIPIHHISITTPTLPIPKPKTMAVFDEKPENCPPSQTNSPVTTGTKKRKLEAENDVNDGSQGSSGICMSREQRPPQEDFVCPQCGKSFAYLCYMNKHIRMTHNRELCERKHECVICKMRFAKRGNLERHSMVHKGIRSFSCDRCGKAFFHRSDLQAHINSHLKISPFTCDYCQKGFVDKLHIIEHVNRHTGQKPFPCGICGKQFGSVKNLKLHEKIHEPNPTYRCEECNKTFTNRIYFLGHQRKHSGQLFGCLQCGKTFVHKYSLTQHEALHRAGGGFACDVCGKRFDKRNHLRVHAMLHTGERPHGCPHCAKRFHVASHLRVHLKLHTGERSFYCDFCGKGFVQKSHYVDHVRVHTGERPFACTECGRAFCQRQQLRQHMRTHNKGRATTTTAPLG